MANRPRRCNCIWWAAHAWWRWKGEGAHFSCRLSRHLPGLHWLVSYRGRVVHFEPLEPRTTWWRAMFHKIWFEGYVKWGDD